MQRPLVNIFDDLLVALERTRDLGHTSFVGSKVLRMASWVRRG